MRISCIGLVRIIDDEGRFAVLVHRKSSMADTLALSPIGGAFKIKPEGRTYLQALLGQKPLELESADDLRFFAKDHYADTIHYWFQTREGRETLPTREFAEELVDDTRILTPDDLQNVRFKLAGFYQEKLPTVRAGYRNTVTLRFIEVFDTICQPAILEKLRAAAVLPDPELHFVTADEINAGRTKTGHLLTSVSKALLAHRHG